MASSPGIVSLSSQPLLTRPLPVLILISLLATAIYSNTFSASFQFDDRPNIIENPKIKHLENFLDLSGSRYVGFLTFALNYHFGGLHVFGYHLINLLIHITNGFLVYTLVLLLFKASSHNSQPSTFNSQLSTSSWIALATALLFIAHPLQTQAVTYIVQRFASLAALFYLLAVVCYLKWRLTIQRPEGQKVERSKGIASAFSPLDLWTFRPFNLLWYISALLSTILAMKTKENSFTLPLMLLLVEAVFFRPLRGKQWASLIPFLLTLPLVPLSHPGAIDAAEAGLAQETTEISRASYLFTQFRVMVTYLRLLFLPMNQNLDYDYPIYHSLFDPSVFFSFLFLGALFGLALYLLFNSQLSTHNSQLISFGLLWFFLTLSVESSIIPIRDVIFEHRVYLPSVGFFLACIIGVQGALSILKTRFHYHLSPITYYLIFSFIVISLSSATYQRNLIWNEKVTLWEDVVAKAPNKARGYTNLGSAYATQGRLDEVIRTSQTALKLQPNYAPAHNNLANAYRGLGRLEEAIREYQTVLQLQPNYVPAYNNLANAYRDLGRLEEAILEYQTALRLQPNLAEAHSNLANAYEGLGHFEEAIREYQAAIKLQPNFAEVHYNLGALYKDLRRFDEATASFKRALQIRHDFPQARQALEALPR